MSIFRYVGAVFSLLQEMFLAPFLIHLLTFAGFIAPAPLTTMHLRCALRTHVSRYQSATHRSSDVQAIPCSCWLSRLKVCAHSLRIEIYPSRVVGQIFGSFLSTYYALHAHFSLPPFFFSPHRAYISPLPELHREKIKNKGEKRGDFSIPPSPYLIVTIHEIELVRIRLLQYLENPAEHCISFLLRKLPSFFAGFRPLMRPEGGSDIQNR